MADALKGLFGGGSDDIKDKLGVEPDRANDFVNRYMQGDPSEGFDDDEAVTNFQKVAQNASPEQMERATRQALGNMSPNQRGDFARMLEQRRAGGGTVPIQRAGEGGSAGSGGGGMGVDDILGGLMGGGGGGMGGILGGLLGGGGGGGSQGGGGLGGVLGGLLGGGDDDSDRTRPRSQSGAQAGGGMMGGLGDLMGSAAGKALIGGIAAFAMKEMMDKK